MPKNKNFDFSNQEIAELLRSVASAYQIKGDSQFKIIAYQKAADSIEHATSEIKDLWDEGKLDEIPGIGSSIASSLDELFKTGKVKHFESITKDLPKALFPLLVIPGIGAKTAYKLCQNLNLTDPKTVISDIEKAALAGKISKMPTFGEDSEKEIIRSIAEYRLRSDRMLLSEADEVVADILVWLAKEPAIKRADPLGSLRRRVSTVGDIDISLATNEPKKAIEHITKYPKISRVIESGATTASIRLRTGEQIDIMIQPQESYGALIQHFTGSKQHNIHLRELAMKKGLSLSEYGIKSKLANGEWRMAKMKTEEEFYKELGMEWIPPEMREDMGEIELALEKKLPNLVELKNIKGDLHTHSNFDIETSHDLGSNSFMEMLEEGSKLGYEYLGFTEHNPSYSKHNETQIIDLLKAKKLAIEQINSSGEKRGQKLPKILNGIEIDIRPDGSLSIPEKGLDFVDYAIISIHSSFRLTKELMTKRILASFNHPKIKILGHPTGRKLNQREGIELDWTKIFDFCLKNDKWLEINAWPNRLDLPDFLVFEAVKRGVKMVINSDSHKSTELPLTKYGVSVARRGWATKKDIINTLGYNEIVKELTNS